MTQKVSHVHKDTITYGHVRKGKKTWEWFCEARKCTQCLKVQFNFTRFVLEKSHFWGLFFTPGQWILNQTIKI